MGWFVGMACLPLMYKHSEYMADHNWLPILILAIFAVAVGILIICIQKVCIFYLKFTSYLAHFKIVFQGAMTNNNIIIIIIIT